MTARLVGRVLKRPVEQPVSEAPWVHREDLPATAPEFSSEVMKRGGFAASHGDFYLPADCDDVRTFQAREALTERIAGLAEDYPDPEQRIWPFALAFSEFVPNLDPVADADLITMGNAVMEKALDRD